MKREATIGLCVVLAALLACKSSSKGGSVDAGAAVPIPITQAAEKPKEAQLTVDIKDLLSEYKDNEIRADQKYKDKIVVVGGVVRDVKKDIMGKPYVILGNLGDSRIREIPSVQCFTTDEDAATVASLSKGDVAVVRGRVQGLMMNVLIKDCGIKTKAKEQPK
jgi:hypothetical protein